MKRPSQQAKLLFFNLLKGSAAAIAVQSSEATNNICLRLARRGDIPSIQRCNLATLPENYNQQFYLHHLRQYPNLCLVAEHMGEQHEQTQRFNSPFSAKPDPKIVGYVLGKLDVETNYNLPTTWDCTDVNHEDMEDLYKSMRNPVKTGHVTSLAVLREFRRMGLAGELMHQLHLNLESEGCSVVGLHVRKSNMAAVRLYERDGYCVENQISSYYQDGEDAYFMRKILPVCEATTTNNHNSLPRILSNRPDEASFDSRDQPQAQQGRAGISIAGTLW